MDKQLLRPVLAKRCGHITDHVFSDQLATFLLPKLAVISFHYFVYPSGPIKSPGASSDERIASLLPFTSHSRLFTTK